VRAELARLLRGRRERLVHDNGVAGVERRGGQRHVGAVWRGDDHEVQLLGPQLFGVVEREGPRVVGDDLGLAFGVGRHDGGQPQAGGGRDQRGVEDGARDAVAEQPHPQIGACVHGPS